MEEINGHHAGLAIFQRPCGGELEVALSVDEVGLKGWSKRVALPCAAVDLFAGLAGDGIVDGDHAWFVRGKVLYQSVPHATKKNRLVHALLGVKTVVGGPIGILAATGANEIADRGFGRA